MAKDKLTGRVSYRLGSQAFKEVQKLAAGQDISPNEWCRQVVLEKLKSQSQGGSPQTQGGPPRVPRAEERETEAITKGEQIAIEEIMRVRWLLQYGIRQYLMSQMKRTQMTVDDWQYFVEQAGGGGVFRGDFKKWLEAYGYVIKQTG